MPYMERGLKHLPIWNGGAIYGTGVDVLPYMERG